MGKKGRYRKGFNVIIIVIIRPAAAATIVIVIIKGKTLSTDWLYLFRTKKTPCLSYRKPNGAGLRVLHIISK